MTDRPSAESRSTRREFLKVTAMGAAAGLGAASVLSSAGCSASAKGSAGPVLGGKIGPNAVILFQGDSITDSGRDKRRQNAPNDAGALGGGYVLLTASQLLAEHPGTGLKIFNRGISGNKVFQLAQRWDDDCIAVKPDFLSILIGVNDIWHRINGQYDGTVEVYERDYRALLERTLVALPQVKLVICEPFVLRCGAVNDKWFPDFDGYRASAKKVAGEFNAVWVPFQSVFDKAARKVSPNYWANDGVHPTVAGCHLMAQAWLKAVSAART